MCFARKVYQKRKTEIQERRFFPERIGRRDPTLAEVIDDHLARVRGKLRSIADQERYGLFWKDKFGDRTLRQITPGDIERVAMAKRKDSAPATVNRYLEFLKRVFNVAIADDRTDSNPVRKVKLFKENNQRVRYLTDQEEDRLRTEIGPRWWPLVAIALNTGLRQGEQLGLRWDDIDFGAGVITVACSKHGESRTVPMNDAVGAILRALPSRFRGTYVFPSQTGDTPLDADNFRSRVFNPALKRAGIENFRWHDLRHTFASRLAMQGEDLLTIKDLLGHKTMQMTLRYAHLSPGHRRDAVQRLARNRTGTNTGTDGRVESRDSQPDR